MKIPRSLFYLFLMAASILYIVTAVHTPIVLMPSASHDDGLFISLGRSISEGNWLGPFSQYTLMKGSGYPIFLALANWFGVTISLAHALFHCFAIVVFTIVVDRVINSNLISLSLSLLLIYCPITLSTHFLRIAREKVYCGQLLLVLAGLIAIFFLTMSARRRIAVGAATGVVLAWLFLTREESMWVAPAILIVIAGSFFQNSRRHGVGIIVAALVASGAFFAGEGTVRLINKVRYGKFVDVDVKEANFLAALKALHGVRSGGTRPFVSITRDARSRVYAVSPAFASLREYLEGPNGSNWGKHNCQLIPISCGDIGSGWFMWALRDAAARQGHYSSPIMASRFFGQMAAEINSACARRELECAPQYTPELAPVTWSDLAHRMPPRYVDAFHMLLFLDPPAMIYPSSATDQDLADALRFLNYPLHSPPDVSTSTYTVMGWYDKPDRGWFSVSAKTSAEARWDLFVDRTVSMTGAEQAVKLEPNFRIRLQCTDDCTLVFGTSDGSKVEGSLADLQRGSIEFNLGGGRLHFDSTTKYVNPAYALTPLERVVSRFRIGLLKRYGLLSIPILILGAISFIATIVLYRMAVVGNICFVLSLVTLTLVLVRITLLILIDVTTFPALFPLYAAPAYFMLICWAIFAYAAWLQLAGIVSKPAEHSGFIPTDVG